MKRILCLMLAAMSFFTVPCAAQAATAPATEWAKCFGGAKDDVFADICLTNDAGYATAGYTYSNDGDIPANSNMLG